MAIILCGCGKVNAALSATLLAIHTGVGQILVTGLSGGLATGLKIGDIVIADSLVQHDMDARPLFPQHEIPFEGISMIELSSELGDLLATAAQKVLSENGIPALDQAKVVRGLVATGDRFVSNHNDRESILSSLPQTLCIDMESAAIAQVCRAADIPLGVMRIISDAADENAEMDFAHFVEQAASRACAETVQFALRAFWAPGE